MQKFTSGSDGESRVVNGSSTDDERRRHDDAIAATENERLAQSRSSHSLCDANGATWVVIIHKPGPMWSDPKLGFLDQQAIQAHIEHYRQLLARGQLFMGGPFLNDGGGLMILSADAGVAEVAKFAQSDPAVRSGLLHAEVHPWLAFMGHEGSAEGDRNTREQ